ncbi:MAG: glycoside hydrolase family 88 protein [candidate division KSB1 bacterium]|nr:glycoside hydrolase family 88 protein [candidate division KSB1 bacterium]MDZ7302567.1 glycoside hydrolase family 88 protein [candidate division KSB1 bacterium]MDZ7310667.1 glycoside hydrolase family 88 protein [candidate division KSB1 bacterium]
MRRIFRAVLVLGFSWFYLCTAPSSTKNASDTESKLRAVADAVLKDATFHFVDQKNGKRFASPEEAPGDAQLRPESAYNDWRYWNGVLNIAMIKLAEALNEPAYLEFARKNIAFSFDNYGYFEKKYQGEGKWNYPFGQRFIMEELDDCGAMGASLIEVHRRDPQDRYRAYIDQTAEHILTRQSRMEDGTLVRSFPHQWTLWADDLYMSLSFLSRMGEFTGEARYFDDAAQQVINFHQYLFDEQKGLMHHCWYSDVNRPGVAFWGRANGWAMLAQVDLLDRLPKNHPQRNTLLALLQRHILGIAQYQSGEGLWHQLLDKVDSYLETSCSAMFTYTIARAINKGYIEPRYASIAQRGWEGVRSKIHADGQVEGVCTGTGVSDDLVHYYRRPAPLNDVHGIGAVLLAGAEVLQLPR